MEPLPESILTEMEAAIAGFDRLYPDVCLEHRLIEKVKGKYLVDAPHYLMISGNGGAREEESAGFLYEQLILWLDAKGIGSVWLGGAIDAQKASRENDILAIGFGYSDKSIHRSVSEFKRKEITEITNTPDSFCIEAVHVAPSGMNSQAWYFEQEEKRVLVYESKLKPPLSLLYKHVHVDLGIALCHYALACKKCGQPFA